LEKLNDPNKLACNDFLIGYIRLALGHAPNAKVFVLDCSLLEYTVSRIHDTFQLDKSQVISPNNDPKLESLIRHLALVSRYATWMYSSYSDYIVNVYAKNPRVVGVIWLDSMSTAPKLIDDITNTLRYVKFSPLDAYFIITFTTRGSGNDKEGMKMIEAARRDIADHSADIFPLFRGKSAELLPTVVMCNNIVQQINEETSPARELLPFQVFPYKLNAFVVYRVITHRNAGWRAVRQW